MNTVNFVNPLSSKKQRAMKGWIIISGCALAILIAYITITYIQKTKKLAMLKQKYTRLQEQMGMRKDEHLEQLNDEQATKKLHQLTKINHLVQNNIHPILYLEEISSSIPKNTRLTRIVQETKKSFAIHGESKDIHSVINFLHTLEQSPNIDSCTLASIERHPEIKNYLLFIITAQLRKTTSEKFYAENKTSD